MNPALLLFVAATMAPASAATTVNGFSIAPHATFVTKSVADELDQQRPPGTAASPTHQVAGKQMMIMVQGGLVTCCGSTGFDVGVGAAFMPLKDNDKFEINGDFNFGRLFSTNLIYISFNGQYDFHLNNSKAVPFAGGGIGIAHTSGATNTAFQLLFGAQFEMSSGRAVRAQVRFLFTSGASTTLILGGFAF